ncbi:hypothetical protein HPG02_05040 [Pediococcus pentosaceus]|uniref:hypothetical protein n=1 Tax=Pediococcus pentosaceus TaxID=1255 RepID=UPI001C1E984F|nr:hypothetical protein [Pediococcus pentosaceus]MBU7002981.1 hypothetical protein [Pediococcus pentosaceus]MCG9226122.1 hypothetical protein [Pediococcus pentosaceus]MDA8036425.1 hypothetical protein [Pediococcus pentosaceus]
MKIRIDITNKRFGKLVAKYPSGKAKNGNTIWHCVCDCGNETDVELQHLKVGSTKSCGSCSRVRYDLTGQQFSRLKVLRVASKKSAAGNTFWVCQCTYGNIIEADGYRLRRGSVRSCGCLRKEKAAYQIRANQATLARMGNIDALKDVNGNPIQSIKIGARNTSGVIGVSFDNHAQRWLARMMVKGNLVLNSSFADFEDAVQARKEAEKKYLNSKASV